MSNLLSLTFILTGSVILLGIVALILKKRGKPTHQNPSQKEHIHGVAEEGCCGAHEICEKESLLSGISEKIDYYDDEELDRFKGKNGNDYAESEISEFREIFYTLQETDVSGWIRSLQLRNIALPEGLKDEVFLIVGERRFQVH